MTLLDVLNSILNGKYKRIAIIADDISEDIVNLFNKFNIPLDNGYYIVTKENAKIMIDYLSEGLYKNQTKYDYERSLETVKGNLI